MANIFILGAGGFGTALALHLARNDNEVTLWGRNHELIGRYNHFRRNDRYPWLATHKFPDNITLSAKTKVNLGQFDFIVLAVPTSQLCHIPLIRSLRGLPPLVLVQKGLDQKGMAPTRYFLDQRNSLQVLLFTGAAFGEDIANGAEVEMILSQRRQDLPIAEDFARSLGQSIWPQFTTDVRGVSVRNTLRTIASFQLGAVAGYFGQTDQNLSRSTMASIAAAIAAESRLIARADNVSGPTLDPNSGIGRILEADILLCQNPGSRNYALGQAIGQGLSLRKAQGLVQGTTECLTNIEVVANLLKDSVRPAADLPWFLNTIEVIYDKITIDQAVKQIFARRDRRFH